MAGSTDYKAKVISAWPDLAIHRKLLVVTDLPQGRCWHIDKWWMLALRWSLRLGLTVERCLGLLQRVLRSTNLLGNALGFHMPAGP